MIDLHLHTTASDGRLSPTELVARVAAAGITTMSVTDHDTVAALVDVGAEAGARGIRLVAGIEITSVADGRDVHLLGYFFDSGHAPLLAFLEGQRALRVARVREIGARLARLGMPVDVEALVTRAATRPGSSVGRPQIARALVRAGHVGSIQEAFERWLATGLPAFVPRSGPAPAAVVDMIHAAGGVVSFAHPAVTKRDELIPPLADHGLDAIEVYHSDHTPEDEVHYRGLAARLGILISGGSDFHGDPSTPLRASPSTQLTAGAPSDSPRTGPSKQLTAGAPSASPRTGPSTQLPAGAPSASLRTGPPAAPSRSRRNSLGVVSLPAEALTALEDRAAQAARTR